MSVICSFIRREPVFTIAFLAAVFSCFLVTPDAKYAEYIDMRTLALLYCLMVVVAGMRKAGVFTALAHGLCTKANSVRTAGIMLVCLCFFSSMLITNDIALLVFIPFTVIVLSIAERKQDMIRIIVLETAAANLGSILTPVGNPQNLYLYSFYNMSFRSFLAATSAVWLLSLLLLLAGCLLLPKAKIHKFPQKISDVRRRHLFIYLALFGVCLLSVVRIVSWPVMLLVIVAVILAFDRRTLLDADFILLLTFVAFFIFAGNLARIGAVESLLGSLLEGREFLTSLLASQIISNVPAALTLSGFTDNATALLLGVDIGGLGTPVASLASLISLKLYSITENSRPGKYLLEFTAVNAVLLILLSIFWLVTD